MKKFIYILFAFSLFASCTTDITLDLPTHQEQIVVEGHISNDQPPFITLTRSQDYYGSFNVNDLESIYVNDAVIVIKDSRNNVDTLKEWCISDFSVEFQEEIALQLGFEFSSSEDIPNICFYTISDLLCLFTGNCTLIGEEEVTYWLEIYVEGKVLTAVTKIPQRPQVTEIFFEPHPDASRDSLFTLYAAWKEPDSIGNYYRYLTKRNEEEYFPPLGVSVFDDAIINGQNLSIPFQRGADPNQELDPETFTYFFSGDEVGFQLISMDVQHYNFWLTLDSDGGDSPFTSPTIIRSNINGGLGIWGGYGIYEGTITAPE